MDTKTNIVLHPELAVTIAREVNARAVACSMVTDALMAKPYVHQTYLFWREEHIRATKSLAAMGIVLSSYDIFEEKAQ